MTNEEIKAKLKGYVDAGGDDAVLPAILLNILKSHKQIKILLYFLALIGIAVVALLALAAIIFYP